MERTNSRTPNPCDILLSGAINYNDEKQSICSRVQLVLAKVLVYMTSSVFEERKNS